MGLTYNVRVGTTPGGNNIMSSLTDSTGWRKIVGMGNVYQNTSWWLKDLKEGIYYWSVQAIDNSFAGGPFSEQDTFSIVLPIQIIEQPTGITTCLGDSISMRTVCNHFFPLTYQWYRDSMPLLNETDSVLIIRNASLSHDGQYYCLISNRQSPKSSDTVSISIINQMGFHLETYKPYAGICPGDSVVLKTRKNFSFACEPLQYQWFRNDILLPGETDSLLILSGFNSQDTADYFCMAAFESIHSYSDTMTVSFGMAYHLEKHQPYSLICSGDSLVLKAKKSGSFVCEPTIYQWYRDDELLPAENDSLLIISSFSNADVGSYMCKAIFGQTIIISNSMDLAYGSAYPYALQVQQHDGLRCPGDSCNLKVIKTVTFSCTPDSCQWFKNHELLANQQDTILRFEPFTEADHGYYFCKTFYRGTAEYTDTLYLTFETANFKGDSLFSSYYNILCDINLDNTHEVFQYPSPYYPYNSTNMCDIDRDGHPELIGRQDSVRFFKWNDLSWVQTAAPLPVAYVLRSRDLDNDGDADFLIHKGYGYEPFEEQCVKALFYEGNAFSSVDIMKYIWNASIDLVDIDNDQDYDIFITGISSLSGYNSYANSKVFINNNGTFNEIPVSIVGFTGSSNDWGDYDNDGDLDLIVSGEEAYWPTNWPPNPHTIIYQNNGGSFAQMGFNVPYTGWVQWMDYDNDGNLDFRIGQRLFHQENGTFYAVNTLAKDGLLVDFDGDGDQDILGYYQQSWWLPAVNQLFINENCNQPNTPPSAPFNMQVNALGDSVNFFWGSATDAQTPSPGLSYNMRVGTTPGGCQIMSPMSNANGFRQVVELGNVQQNLGWWLHGLQPGNYYWSVQAIDNSYAGGPFAAEQTFTIPGIKIRVFPEGLLNTASGILNKSHNATGEQFSGNIADKITIELHEATTPYNLIGSPVEANLLTTGYAQFVNNAVLPESFYIVVKHRNSIETWSALPVNNTYGLIQYDFTQQITSAFGQNLKQVGSGFGLFSGDINQDGIVDALDYILLDNQAAINAKGYLPEDLNGDGSVDIFDMLLLENNANEFIGVKKP